MKEKVRSWALPEAVELEVYERFTTELANHGDEVLKPLGAPLHGYSYTFVVNNGADKHAFVFVVDRDSDAATLDVIDGYIPSRAIQVYRNLLDTRRIPVVD